MKYITIYRPSDDCISEHPRNSIYIHGQVSASVGQLWYCWNCASIWCRVIIVSETNIMRRFTAVCNLCETCSQDDVLVAKTHSTLPGSILMEGYNTIDELSTKMLRRELLLELKAMKLLITNGVL